MGRARQSPQIAFEDPDPPAPSVRVARGSASRRPPEFPCSAAWAGLSVVDWARMRGQELLFVDGNHFLLELTARAFGGVGATCRTAPTRAEAIRILEADARIRVVILDYEIAPENLGDLVRRMSAIRPGILFVGTSERERRLEFARRGVRRFVPKPWCVEDLVGAIGV